MSDTRWHAVRPDPRSSRWWRSESCKNGQFQCLSLLLVFM